MKLEPTAEQLELIAKAAGMAVWEMQIAFDIANHGIPEGAPVGTIARRPDGGWVAHRTVGLDAPFWEYFRLDQNAPARKNQYDADSWPQIRPDQWPDQAGLDWFPAGEELLVPRPDPTAQQEPGAFNRFPGIENPTTSDYIGAAVADEQLKLVFALRDVRKERGMEIAEVAEDADVLASEISMFESGSSNPTLSLVRRYAKAVGAVFTVDVRKWEDTPAQQEPEEGPPCDTRGWPLPFNEGAGE